MQPRRFAISFCCLLVCACGSDADPPTDARPDGGADRTDGLAADVWAEAPVDRGPDPTVDGSTADGGPVDGTPADAGPADAAPADAAPADISPADAPVDVAVDLPIDTPAPTDVVPDVTPPAAPKCGDPGAPCPTIDPFCTADATEPPAGMPSGMLSIGPTQDLIALCGGWVLVGDRKLNQIVVRNAFSGETRKSYQLTATPGDLELDAEQGVLYATLDSATAVARLDLKTDTLTTIPVSAPAHGLAVGPPGTLFVLAAGVVVIDTATGAVKRELPAPAAGDLVVFDRVRSQLFMADTGLSPSSLSRSTFDPAALTLTLAQGRSAGSNGQDLAISPDHARIAYPNGAGNSTPTYTIVDYSAADLGVTSGAWNTGPYPRSAAFSPDGQRLAASNGEALIVFGVATHAEVARLTPQRCSYGQFGKVAWSRSGKYVFMISYCQFDRSEGLLVWYRPGS